MPRPTLLPGLPRLWRGRHTLQLGLDPARAVVVELPDPRAARLLDLIDGTRSERVALDETIEHGVAAGDARSVLDALLDAGLIIPGASLLPAGLTGETRRRLTGEAAALALRRTESPAATLRRRRNAVVALSGTGRLAPALAVALAEAGIGHLHLDLPGWVTAEDLPGGPLRADDLGQPLRDAVRAAALRAAPDLQTRPVRRGTPSLVLQFGCPQPVTLLAAAHLRRRQAHLEVAVHEGAVRVGPLVPGTGEPCLSCIDLHRRDRDPDWPQLVVRPGTPEPCSVATLLAGTAHAVAEALTFLDGGTPETLGATIEISRPGRFRRRTWPPHPRCGCGRRPRRAKPRTPGRTPTAEVSGEGGRASFGCPGGG